MNYKNILLIVVVGCRGASQIYWPDLAHQIHQAHDTDWPCLEDQISGFLTQGVVGVLSPHPPPIVRTRVGSIRVVVHQLLD
jgi:hypothetical protein